MARAGTVYTCPKCGEESPHHTTCHRCGITPVDEKGHTPPLLFEREVLLRTPADSSLDSALTIDDGLNLLGGLGSVVGFAFSSLARQVRQLNVRRRLRARFETPLTSIAEAHGDAHVRGRVEVLEPVAHRDGDPVGAFLFRIKEGNSKTDIAIETQVACGKLLVRDDSGAALIDDDFITILPKVGDAFPASGNVDLRIRGGDRVEVVGRAAQRHMPELELGGFRESAKVLVFDGTPRVLVVIRPVELDLEREPD